MEEATTEDVGKDIAQCNTCYHKTNYLQLKSDYKLVKTLRGLSGFGWDEGDQMVTAPLAV